MKRFDIYLVNLDPTIGRELKKKRPVLIISPDEMNDNLDTVIIAPMTTSIRKWKTNRSNPNSNRISLYLLILGVIAVIMPFIYPINNPGIFGDQISCMTDSTNIITCYHPGRPELKLMTISIGLILSLSAVLLVLARFKSRKVSREKISTHSPVIIFVLGAALLLMPYLLIPVFNIGTVYSSPGDVKELGKTLKF